jgi:diaminopimelate epimerase
VILHFYKYHGTGNDFIMLDARDNWFPALSNNMITSLCDRRFGIGADGLVLIRPNSRFDFTMIYYNSDGHIGTMCGNAGRCAVDFAKKIGIITDHSKFEGSDGIHEGWIQNDIVRLTIQPVKKIKISEDHYELNTGSPHYVKFVKNIEKTDVKQKGAVIRYSGAYGKKGINVNFVSLFKDGIFVRTYERGVEDETLSCGTGMVASAICAAIRSKTDKNSFAIYTRGGKLHISFHRSGNQHFEDIILEGPASFVFEGNIKIE